MANSYVVQEYITGNYPDWRWFAHHLPMLAAFIKRYHNDQPLTSLLAANAPTSYAEHVARDLATLENQFISLHTEEIYTRPELSQHLKSSKRGQNIYRLFLWCRCILTPTPKTSCSPTTSLLMVDWDDIQLSDPMRDAGLLLWWYVAQHQWHEFFEAYGVMMNDTLVERIYWWAARTSFAIALWHVEHGYDCRAFLLDFLAAVNGESNPHAVFE